MNILVLLGGDSPEREVSIRSGNSVIVALNKAEHSVASYDPADGDGGLQKAVENIDVVLPILHGKNGEDGVIQKKLEDLSISYLGADSKSSVVASDKCKTHEVLARAGVVTPQYSIVNLESFGASPLAKLPFVLKPIDGGSSVDLMIARELSEENYAASKKLLEKYDEMILEELIEGIEITVSVLGQEVLPVIAIIPPADGEFDYENKYNGKTQEICPVPKDLISESVQAEAQRIALIVQNSLGVRHLSRTDMIVQPDGRIVVLELNTIPGMTGQSLYPKAAAVSGISMVELVKKFIKMTAEGR